MTLHTRMRWITGTLVLAALLAAQPALADLAPILNPSFETGDFTSWTTTVPAGASAAVVTKHTSPNPTDSSEFWDPVWGNHFALLKTDGGGSVTRLDQTFTAAAGDIVNFSIFFDGNDLGPISNNDAGYARLFPPVGTPILLYHKDIAAVGDFGSDGWTYVVHTITTPGEYKLEFTVENFGDNLFDSYVGVDMAPTPEDIIVPVPAAALLGVIGLGMTGWMTRRKHG